MADNVPMSAVISCQEAIAGELTRYFTGVPCKNGHLVPRSTCDGKCVKCKRLRWNRWADENRDYIDATSHNWIIDHHERRLEINRASQARHRADHAAYYLANRDRILANVKTWGQTNPEKPRQAKRNHKALKRGADGTHTLDEVQALLVKQKRRCANCRNSIRKGYHVDHIVPLVRGGGNDIANIQLLCPTCNLKKSDKDPITWARENGRLL